MNKSPKIMLVEDEIELALVVEEYLVHAGMTVTMLHSGVNAVNIILAHNPDLLILDIMLPGMDGLEICRDIRAVSNIPILLETARAEEVDRILGLETGVDDYICKPFSPRELVARVKANLRRIELNNGTTSNLRLSLEENTWTASMDNQDLALTRREFQLLKALSDRHGCVFSRAQLLDFVFGMDSSVTDRTIDSHVKNIRLKIKAIAPDVELIRSVYGVGYAVEIPE